MQPSFFQAYARCVVPHRRFTDCIFLSIILKCGNSRHKELETRIGLAEAQAAARIARGVLSEYYRYRFFSRACSVEYSPPRTQTRVQFTHGLFTTFSGPRFRVVVAACSPFQLDLMLVVLGPT